jgi:DeoR family transcriptional regulator, aga operon transcriptional repressor
VRDTSERRTKIIARLREQGSVQVAPLADLFRVSTQTIRQDLKFLANIGLAARSYGGAVLHSVGEPAPETEVNLKRRLHASEKSGIGRAAAALIQAGDSLILDSGTTTLQIAMHIPEGIEARIVTNDLAIANELAHHKNVQLTMLGGSLRRKTMSMYGTQAESAMQSLSVGKVFLGVDGFDLERGITTHFEPEAILNRLMCAAAAQVIVVTDSSKFGRTCLHRILDPARVHTLITDDRLDAELAARLTQLGIKLLRVSRS